MTNSRNFQNYVETIINHKSSSNTNEEIAPDLRLLNRSMKYNVGLKKIIYYFVSFTPFISGVNQTRENLSPLNASVQCLSLHPSNSKGL
jgi:hypothetical protein